MKAPARRLVAGLILPVVALLAGRVTAHAASHRAALVVEHGNGSLIARCVAFAEEAITGLQLIERSGVESQTRDFGFGTAVCQLDFEPAAVPSNCFGSGAYWQYYRHAAGGWTLSPSGASGSSVHDGDLDGWHYAAAPAPPPAASFAQVCGAPAPAPSSPASTAQARAPTPAAVAAPAAPTTAAIQAVAPVITQPPARTVVLLPDTSPANPRAGPAGDGAAGPLFAVSVALLGGLLVWRRRPT